MKEKRQLIWYVIWMIAVLLIVVMTAFFSFEAFGNMISAQRESCWSVLENTSENVRENVVNHINHNYNSLKIVARGIEESGTNNTSRVAESLTAILPLTDFSRLDCIYQDDWVLMVDKEKTLVASKWENVAFDVMEDSRAPVSHRFTDVKTGTECLYMAVPVVEQNVTTAYVVGVLECARLPQVFNAAVYDGQAQAFLVDREDGNFVMDVWHETLGNFYADDRVRTPIPGYPQVDMNEEIQKGRKGVNAYVSTKNNVNSYMYYEPIDEYGWELLISAQEPVIFASAQAFQDKIVMIAWLEGFVLVLVFLALVYQMKRKLGHVWVDYHRTIRQNQELQRDRRRDFLTGLQNRQSLSELLQEEPRESMPIQAIFMMDIDDYKSYNDHYGHVAGDQVLQTLGSALADYGEKHQVKMFRYGGEEILGISYHKEKTAAEIAQELLDLVASLDIARNDVYGNRLTVSIGYTTDVAERDKMIDHADAAMYWAKKRGKDQAVSFEEMKERRTAKKTIHADLLTDCYHRRKFEEEVRAWLPVHQETAYFLLIGVDAIKHINTMLGYTIGDETLKGVADEIKQVFDGEDLIGRVDGDKFALLLTAPYTMDDVRERVALLNKRVTKTIVSDQGDELPVTVSTGIAVHPLDGSSYEQLFGNASQALLHAMDQPQSHGVFYGQVKAQVGNAFAISQVSDAQCHQILDSLTESGVYVITEAEHRVLFYNQRVKEVAPNIKIGDVCHEVWDGYCEACPLRIIGDRPMAHSVAYDDPFGPVVDITATRMMWNGTVPAFIIRVFPHLEDDLGNRANQNLDMLLAPGFNESLYVINADYDVVTYSPGAKKQYPQLERGKKCYACLMGQSEPCGNCPATHPETANGAVKVIPISTLYGDNTILVFTSQSQEERKTGRSAILLPDSDTVTIRQKGKRQFGFASNPGGYPLEEVTRVQSSFEEAVNELLRTNGGVGLVSGYFDEQRTIRFVTEMALHMMGFDSFEDFVHATNESLLALIPSQQEQELCCMKLNRQSVIPWHLTMRGNSGQDTYVQVMNRTIVDENGRREWCLSLRQVNDRFKDLLTGGYSWEGLLFYMDKLRAEGFDFSKYAVLYWNIDNFKAINELYTTSGGDNLLQIVYLTAMNSFLKPVVGARIESDNFIFLVPREHLDLNRLNQLLKITWDRMGRMVRVHLKCGVYYIDHDGIPTPGMLDRAKLAKQYVRTENVQAYAVYDSTMKNDYMDKAAAQSDYERAIANREFEVFYQPVVDAQTGKIVSAEALIRWRDPEKGMVMPSVFLPVLEKTGFIARVDTFVVESVFAFLRQRYEAGLPIVPVSINLSWLDFSEARLVNAISERVEDEHLPKGMLRYELTETAYAALESTGRELLTHLKANGSKILLDDFGRGYSSFGLLQDYDFDTLKLDISFTRQLLKNEKVRSIVSAIIAMCHSLNISVVAEGVEVAEEAAYLRQQGCDFIQGYYYAKPMSTQDFTAYLDKLD